MTIAQTGASRTPHDLNHLIFTNGKIGRLQTMSVVPVIGGDSFQQDLVGALKLSPLRRGLTMDSVVDIFSFYIPHRFAYGDEWMEFLKEGIQSQPLGSAVEIPKNMRYKLNHLAQSVPSGTTDAAQMPLWLADGYERIYNNYFKYPWTDDTNLSINDMSDDEGSYGYACAHLKTLWSTPLPPERGGRDIDIPVSGGEATLNIQDLNQAYGALHTEQERELFASRFREVVESLGGHTTHDADQRPRLLKRTTQWASGYDVDGTSEVSLGQYAGRVAQNFKHKVNRFAVPEHGAVWTVALVRFPAVSTQECNYLCNQANPTYAQIAGDPSIVGNHPRVEINLTDLFPANGLANNLFTIGEFPHSQWYRYQAPVVHGDYSDLQGYPFLKAIPVTGVVGVIEKAAPRLVISNDYDEIFQTTQLAHWNVQAKNNVTVMRRLPTARDSLITNN